VPSALKRAVAARGKGLLLASMVSESAASAGVPPTFLLLGAIGGVLLLSVAFFLWRRSSQNSATPSYQHVPKSIEEPLEEEPDDVQKVTIFFGTQTGTSEGFAKVSA
jgi:hypothetical protein